MRRRDIVCFSHLRWDFVYQRPNHLMARAARRGRVFFVEEPTFEDETRSTFAVVVRDGVTVITPKLPVAVAPDPHTSLKKVLDDVVRLFDIVDPILWYYTPMALPWTDHLSRSVTLFDCMDHLAGFNGAPPEMLALESALMERADLVLTGGVQLYKAKRAAHPDVHCFPSSVDVDHFASARWIETEPADQAAIAHPRLGYCGVIDERMDMELVARAAAAHPEWQLLMLGPVVKIDPASLPRPANVHYLGPKAYAELPGYLSGWDVGIMPFAHNEATRFISPTKTPEYLAAGLTVASTTIDDVVEPYGNHGLVEIGDGSDGFVAACERALSHDRSAHRRAAGAFLAKTSWDRTWVAIDALLEDLLDRRTAPVARRRVALRHDRVASVPVTASAPSRGVSSLEP
ncbi:MAG: glycosyltransferase family 1 protein [Chloroflexota bacterium]